MVNAAVAQGEQRNLPVLAIDPSPGKKSTIFDGKEFKTKSGLELRSYLDEPFNRSPKMLLCWDAPLTGPADPASAGTQTRDFTQRLIERFFMRSETGFKTPKGISVLPYSGCPHWTVTRSLLGLPRIGPYDLEYQRLPYRLLPAPQWEQADRPSVVEIHPAVAAWLWCRKDRKNCTKTSVWNYKKDEGVRKELWSIILERTRFPWGGFPTPENDDQFDAAVGYLLGSMYLRHLGANVGKPSVAILGDRTTGSFLLPMDPELENSWREWKKKQ